MLPPPRAPFTVTSKERLSTHSKYLCTAFAMCQSAARPFEKPWRVIHVITSVNLGNEPQQWIFKALILTIIFLPLNKREIMLSLFCFLNVDSAKVHAGKSLELEIAETPLDNNFHFQSDSVSHESLGTVRCGLTAILVEGRGPLFSLRCAL